MCSPCMIVVMAWRVSALYPFHVWSKLLVDFDDLVSCLSLHLIYSRTFLFTLSQVAYLRCSTNATGAPSTQQVAARRHWFLVDAKKLKFDSYTDVLIGNTHVLELTHPPSYSAAASKFIAVIPVFIYTFSLH